jgi:sugar lactone lactonase YvrE
MSAAGEEAFSTRPTAVRDGGKVKIAFAVALPTDVEVAVLDAQGKVVRHLAAGVLGGENPPPKPLRAGLKQQLTWDGADDAGVPAVGGPFQVRVRAGTRARLGKVIGFDPYRLTRVHGLATDDQGNLYVHFSPMYGGGADWDVVRVFDSSGKYLRTIWPPPASLSPQQFQGLPQAVGPDIDPQLLCPANYEALLPKLFPDPSDIVMLGSRVVQGKLNFLTLGGGMKIMSISAADGSCPNEVVRGRLVRLWGEKAAPDREGADFVGPFCGAAAPDGKTIYLAGLQGKTKNLALWKKGRVHAIDMTAPLLPVSAGWQKEPMLGLFEMRTFAEVPIPNDVALVEQPFNDWGSRMGTCAVHGLDVDPDGNLYACDRANDCIVVFDAAGRLLGKIAVRQPHEVAVHPRTGAIYVLARGWKDKRAAPVSLIKLSGYKAGKEVARLDFDQPAAMNPRLALDSSGDPAAVWVSCLGAQGGLIKLVDHGGTFKPTVDIAERVSPQGLDCLWYCWVNPVTDEVFVHDGWGGDKYGKGRTLARFDGRSGKRLECKFNALDMAFDLSGNVYFSGQGAYTTPVWRLTPELKPLPFAGTDRNVTTGRDIYGKYGWGHCQKGLCVARDGSLFAFHMKTWSLYTVVRWTPAGKAVDGFVTGDFPETRAGCLKIDAAGNLYVGMPGYPKSGKPPVSAAGDTMSASVVKLKPASESFSSAGKIKRPETAIDWAGRNSTGWLSGMIRAYPDLAPNGASASGCTCKESRFDLDLYGRLYLPNVLCYRMTLLDNAGNVILKAGQYGNADSQGDRPESPIRKPAIPLGWPMTVGAAPDHGHVYVGDVINSRVVRIDLSWAAETACDANK